MRLKVRLYGSVIGREVSFERGITAITGPNGSGKSTLLDAIIYAVYGQDRFGGSNDVRVEGLFGGSFRRWRTGKNTKLDARVMGRKFAQHRQMMQFFEESGLPTLEQTRITWFGGQGQLGFVGLSPRERRAILEWLLELDVWDRAVEAAKEKHRKAQETLTRLRGKAEAHAEMIEKIRARIADTERQIAELGDVDWDAKAEVMEPPPYSLEVIERAEASIPELERRAKTLEQALSERLRVAEERREDHDRIRGAVEGLKRVVGELRASEAKLTRALNEIIETPCDDEMRSQCILAQRYATDIDREATLESLERVRVELEEAASKLIREEERARETLKAYRDAEALVEEARRELQAVRMELKQARAIVSTKEHVLKWDARAAEIAKLRERRASLEDRLNTLRRQLEEETGRIAALEEKARGAEIEVEVWSEAINDLGPKGVRHHLIAAAVPALTNLTNEYLEMLGAPFTARLTLEKELTKGGHGATLDVVINRGKREVNAPMASGGERVLLDIAMRLALMNAYEQRGVKMPGIFILDETLAPLDKGRRLTVLDGLRRVGVERIVLTSHVDEVFDYADAVITMGER